MNNTGTHKEATEAYKALIANGYTCYLEVGDSVIYFEPSAKGMNYGTACNAGLLKDGEFEWDVDFSADENLQALCEEIYNHYEMGND